MPSANVASTSDDSDKSMTISSKEFAKFRKYQESLKAPSFTPLLPSQREVTSLNVLLPMYVFLFA